MENSNKLALLVEPPAPSKYPPLGLMKISTFLKKNGFTTRYTKGMINEDAANPSDIYITSLFTYDIDILIKTINHYRTTFPEAKVNVGGIAASLMPTYIQSKTGISPHVGILPNIDKLPPDYSLLPYHQWSNFSFVFTTRGCPNKCKFCAVPTLESDFSINESWKDSINKNSDSVMIHDNNILAHPVTHFEDVTNYLAETRKKITFDNGFDCRLFNEQHCKQLAKLNLHSVRFAFDSIRQDAHIQHAIKLCIEHGIQQSAIMVYVLYNFNDTIEDAAYRAATIAKLGVRPYAMRYIPLDAITWDEYVGKHWNRELAHDFFEFVNTCRLSGVMAFEEWRTKWKQKRHKKRNKLR